MIIKQWKFKVIKLLLGLFWYFTWKILFNLQQNCCTKQFKKLRFKISRWCNSVKLKTFVFPSMTSSDHVLRWWRHQTTCWDDDVIEMFTMKICFNKIARLHVIARGNQFLYDETTLHVICRRSTIFINCIMTRNLFFACFCCT